MRLLPQPPIYDAAIVYSFSKHHCVCCSKRCGHRDDNGEEEE